MLKKLWNFLDENTSTVIVVTSFIIVLAFTIACGALAIQGIVISDILIEQFFKFFGYELIALSGIKITKHIKCGGSGLVEAVDETIESLDADAASEMSDLDE